MNDLDGFVGRLDILYGGILIPADDAMAAFPSSAKTRRACTRGACTRGACTRAVERPSPDVAAGRRGQGSPSQQAVGPAR